MKRQEYAEKLIQLYEDTFKKEGQPSERYYQTKPTIPWIGDHYDKHRILIYASAENLGDWVNGTGNRSAFFTEQAFNRHANFWNKKVKGEIGIAPFDTGGLRLVGIMCLRELGFKVPETEDITSYVAVANLSKFSLKGNGNNVDVKTKKDMKPSCNYLQIDLEELKPDLIINVSGNRGNWLDKIFEEFAPNSYVIDLPQYTKNQLGFHYLRRKGLDSQVLKLKCFLEELIDKYETILGDVCEKKSNGVIRSDDFVRYFCLVQRELDRIPQD